MGEGVFVSSDNTLTSFSSNLYNPSSQLESNATTGVLKQPVRVDYTGKKWPQDIAMRCKKWQYTVNAICMCVCRAEVENNGTTLAVYFEELSLTLSEAPAQKVWKSNVENRLETLEEKKTNTRSLHVRETTHRPPHTPPMYPPSRAGLEQGTKS